MPARSRRRGAALAIARPVNGLYVILDADASTAAGWRLPDLSAVCAEAGARVFQVRDKPGSSARLLAATAEIIAMAAQAAGGPVTVIVNDRADVAACARASGVHVGQTDLPPAAVRTLLPSGAIVGRSTHTPDQIDAALAEPISYLAIGPVFETRTKDTGYRAVGLDLVRYAAARAGPLPIVAVGGLTLDRVPAVIEAGARAVAVISDIFTGGDVGARVRAYVQRLEAFRI